MTDPAQERTIVLETLGGAMNQLKKNINPLLIPPEGVSFGYAIRGARDRGGIAAVQGRITLPREGSAPGGEPCSFGSDDGIARILLTAMKFNPRVRSAACLAYSPRAKVVLSENLFLETASGDGAGQPGTSSMDWGIASCCKRGVPDVIFFRERDSSGSRIIIFGEEPADVLNNIIMCSNRI